MPAGWHRILISLFLSQPCERFSSITDALLYTLTGRLSFFFWRMRQAELSTWVFLNILRLIYLITSVFQAGRLHCCSQRQSHPAAMFTHLVQRDARSFRTYYSWYLFLIKISTKCRGFCKLTANSILKLPFFLFFLTSAINCSAPIFPGGMSRIHRRCFAVDDDSPTGASSCRWSSTNSCCGWSIGSLSSGRNVSAVVFDVDSREISLATDKDTNKLD